jgi:hypothetical protein
MLADQRDFFHVESLALLVQQEVFHSRSTKFLRRFTRTAQAEASKRNRKSKNPKKQNRRATIAAAVARVICSGACRGYNRKRFTSKRARIFVALHSIAR